VEVKGAISISRKSLRFSDVQLARLRDILKDTPRAGRFITRAQQLIDRWQESKSDAGAIRTVEKLRANAKVLHKAAKAMSAQIKALTLSEKELLGQLMWVIDKKSYYPGAFTVDQVVDTVRVVEVAASKLIAGGKGGRARLRRDGFIRDIHSAYITRLNRRPEISNAKSNDFTAALKVCLEAAGEPVPKTLVQEMRNALNP
jgi:hypothetical protein